MNNEVIIYNTADDYPQLRKFRKFLDYFSGCIIAGGCFKNIFNDENVRDIDIFFRYPNAYDNAVSYVQDSDEFEFVFENKNCYSVRHKETGIRLELCSTIFGTAGEIIREFDFSIVKFAMWVDDNGDYQVCYDDHFFEHLKMKRMVLDGKIVKPLSTFQRVLKYVRYGYNLCVESKVKLLRMIHLLSYDEIELGPTSFYDGMD